MAKENSWSRKLIIRTSLFIVLILVAGAVVFSLLGSSVTKNLDTYTYYLPFEKGRKHRVVQGYGGLFSHNHIAAIDFDMPEGTPVCAAREGFIYRFKDDSDEIFTFTSYGKKDNFINLKNNDTIFK